MIEFLTVLFDQNVNSNCTRPGHLIVHFLHVIADIGRPRGNSAAKHDVAHGSGRGVAAIGDVDFTGLEPCDGERHGALDGRRVRHTAAAVVCIALRDWRWRHVRP